MKQTHEADGLYYLSRLLLNREHACREQTTRWYKNNGTGRTPVTLAILRTHYANPIMSGGVSWLTHRMRRKELITYEEMLSYYSEARRSNALKAFMDLLAKRARREGRLPKRK